MKHKDNRPGGLLILTYSNPAVGNVKCEAKHKLSYKGSKVDIDQQYDQMFHIQQEKSKRTCVFQKKPFHLIVVFKDEEQNW